MENKCKKVRAKNLSPMPPTPIFRNDNEKEKI
jgi:hypothetical protein